MKLFYQAIAFAILLLLTACGGQQKSQSTNHLRVGLDSLLLDSRLQSAHIGIYVFDPEKNQAILAHDESKYFVPASNTKIATCYAALKLLGDSLDGIRYQVWSNNQLQIFPTGDPTLLHPDFSFQPVIGFLEQSKTKQLHFSSAAWKDEPLGYGWAWDDYNGSYMTERNALPIYGNTVDFVLNKTNINSTTPSWTANPPFFKDSLAYNEPVFLSRLLASQKSGSDARTYFEIVRNRTNNSFNMVAADRSFKQQTLPFATNNCQTALNILSQQLGVSWQKEILADNSLYGGIPDHLSFHSIRSQPTDSVLKPMMHRSDNFFAEQLLLMAANKKTGKFAVAELIDSLLKNELKDLEQRPKWVDGSGLSRYNLFTPKSFVQLLTKMKNEFGLERLKTIFPTGDEGTLGGLYKNHVNRIFAKTGTLSNQVALSGFLLTRSNQLLVFSVLTNNHMTTASTVRKQVEKLLTSIIDNY
jgi:serine-type D-Ala-D-Ala carboxypeptidase/endopeptidase (penicillin-binding protein 4)